MSILAIEEIICILAISSGATVLLEDITKQLFHERIFVLLSWITLWILALVVILKRKEKAVEDLNAKALRSRVIPENVRQSLQKEIRNRGNGEEIVKNFII